MKLETGMYVRDIHGQIDKIIGFEGTLIEFEKDLIVGYLDSNDFTRASFDILDLIEKGDYILIIKAINKRTLIYSHCFFLRFRICNGCIVKLSHKIPLYTFRRSS